MTFCLVLAVFSVGAYSMKRYTAYTDRGKVIVERVRLIRGIIPDLDRLENEIWGGISVYDPAKSAKVDFLKFDHNKIFAEIMKKVDAAAALTDNPDLQFQIDILRRSVRSLARRTNTIKEKFELKEMDEESTQVLFSDSVSGTTLSDSYVDDMEKISEQIRFATSVINKNIDKYTISEFMQLEAYTADSGVLLNQMKIFFISVCAAALVAAIIVLVAQAYIRK